MYLQLSRLEAIVEKVTLMQQTLKRDFYISNPRIAVLALNPKTNEDEQLWYRRERNHYPCY